jgi:DNA invertase Pin-like site-specific DNA recombinase
MPRVSTDAQDLATQLADLKAAGCAKAFQEKLTGANANRPQLRWMMAALDRGDMVIITAVDRLARDPTLQGLHETVPVTLLLATLAALGMDGMKLDDL